MKGGRMKNDSNDEIIKENKITVLQNEKNWINRLINFSKRFFNITQIL